MSIVRDNLMERPGYTPYCGNPDCRLRMPRTRFDGKQFRCDCGWSSSYEPEFIAAYKTRWQAPPGALAETFNANWQAKFTLRSAE